VIGAIIAEAREIHPHRSPDRACARHVSAIFFVTIGLYLIRVFCSDHWLPFWRSPSRVVLEKFSRAHSVLSSVEMIGALHCALAWDSRKSAVLFIIASLGLSLNVTSSSFIRLGGGLSHHDATHALS